MTRDYTPRGYGGSKDALDSEEAEVQARLNGPVRSGDLNAEMARYSVRNHKTISELTPEEQARWLEKVRRNL